MTIEPGTLAPDAIYDSLRSGILDQGYPPGSTFTESAVALNFGVARPTAKLAIERLVTDGRLRRESHRAARVPELTRHDIVDLFDNRAVVECAAIGALATSGSIPAAAIEAHRAILAGLAHDAPFAQNDIAFHRALVAGQPSPRLARMHALLMGEIELCIGQVQSLHLVDVGDIAQQHQGILDAALAGDAELAIERTRSHIHTSRDKLLARYDLEHQKEA